jgi:hypothetical protein
MDLERELPTLSPVGAQDPPSSPTQPWVAEPSERAWGRDMADFQRQSRGRKGGADHLRCCGGSLGSGKSSDQVWNPPAVGNLLCSGASPVPPEPHFFCPGGRLLLLGQRSC